MYDDKAGKLLSWHVAIVRKSAVSSLLRGPLAFGVYTRWRCQACQDSHVSCAPVAPPVGRAGVRPRPPDWNTRRQMTLLVPTATNHTADQ